MVIALAVNVDRKGQIFAGREEIEFFLEQERVGAEVDVLFARDEAFDDFVDLGVHQRFAAGNGDHRRAALVHGFEAFFGGQFLLQDVRGILDFAAAGAGQIAAEQRLEHEDKRVALAPRKLLLEDVGCNRPRLRNRYRHLYPSGLNWIGE